MNTKWAPIFVFFALVLALGCSDKSGVKGKVTFSEDGSPLTKGTVYFENQASGGALSRGEIQSDGSYTMGTLKASDGVPAGKYKVYIADAHDYETAPDGSAVSIQLIDSKRTSSATTDLTFEVPGGGKTFDIQVERFKK